MKKLLPRLLIIAIVIGYWLSLPRFVLAECPQFTETDYPNKHPDINVDIRGFVDYPEGQKNLINFDHPTEAEAPQLSTLIESNPRPGIINTYRVNMWDWDKCQAGGPIEELEAGDTPTDFATMIGLQTTGENVLVPDSGYDIGGGRDVLVLYATKDSITLKYTGEDDMIIGYGIHLKNFTVDQELLDFYNQLQAAGREELPALCAGQKIGISTGELQVAVRDTGAFMDPRWQNDWWQTDQGASEVKCSLMSMKPGHAQQFSILDDNTRVRAQWSGQTTKKISHTERTNRAEQPNSPSQNQVLATQTTTDQSGLGSSLFSGKLILQPENAAAPEFPGVTKLAGNIMQGFRSLLTSKRLATSRFATNKKQRQIFTTSYVQSPIANLLGITEYVCNDGKPTSDDDCAKHIVYAPTNWPQLVFSLTGLSCELFPSSLASQPELCQLFRYQLPVLDWKAVKYNFIISKYLPSANAPDPDHVKPEFSKVAGILVNILEEAISDILTKITEIFNIKYEVKMGGELPGGGYANKGATSVAAAMTPAKTYSDFAVTTRGQDYSAPMTPEVQFSPADEAQEPLSYNDQRPTRNYTCSTLCGSYTTNRVTKGNSWLGTDKTCPSCDAKDYYIPDPPLPKPSDAPPWCMWDGFGCHFGCDVGKPLPDDPNTICTLEMMQGCGEGKDPFCESGRCNPDEIGPKGDYAIPNPPCPVPYPTDEDQNCGNVCAWQVFCPKEDGGYGSCRYQNAKVCVPTSAIGGQKSCANVCNAVCCLGQDAPNVQCPKK